MYMYSSADKIIYVVVQQFYFVQNFRHDNKQKGKYQLTSHLITRLVVQVLKVQVHKAK